MAHNKKDEATPPERETDSQRKQRLQAARKEKKEGKEKAKKPKFNPNKSLTIPDKYLPHVHVIWDAMTAGQKQSVVKSSQGLLDRMLHRSECADTTTVGEVIALLAKAKPKPKGKVKDRPVELNLQHVKKTNWAKVASTYKVDKQGQELMKAIAVSIVKQGKDSTSARAAAKDFLAQQKQVKGSFKFRNPLHVVDAVEQAVRLKV